MLGDLGVLSPLGLLFVWKKQALPSLGSGERRGGEAHNTRAHPEVSFLKHSRRKNACERQRPKYSAV